MDVTLVKASGPWDRDRAVELRWLQTPPGGTLGLARPLPIEALHETGACHRPPWSRG